MPEKILNIYTVQLNTTPFSNDLDIIDMMIKVQNVEVAIIKIKKLIHTCTYDYVCYHTGGKFANYLLNMIQWKVIFSSAVPSSSFLGNFHHEENLCSRLKREMSLFDLWKVLVFSYKNARRSSRSARPLRIITIHKIWP